MVTATIYAHVTDEQADTTSTTFASGAHSAELKKARYERCKDIKNYYEGMTLLFVFLFPAFVTLALYCLLQVIFEDFLTVLMGVVSAGLAWLTLILKNKWEENY